MSKAFKPGDVVVSTDPDGGDLMTVAGVTTCGTWAVVHYEDGDDIALSAFKCKDLRHVPRKEVAARLKAVEHLKPGTLYPI